MNTTDILCLVVLVFFQPFDFFYCFAFFFLISPGGIFSCYCGFLIKCSVIILGKHILSFTLHINLKTFLGKNFIVFLKFAF